jgi:hypothetical protein
VLQATLDPQELYVLEQRWIKVYREKGASLTNHTDGGEGTAGLKMSDETRKKMSEAHKNSPHKELVLTALHKGAKAAAERLAPARRERALAWNAERWSDPAARERMSQQSRGRVWDDASRERQSAAQRKRFQDPAQRASLDRARAMVKDRTWSEERKLKLARTKGGGAFLDQHGNRYESVRGAGRALGICSSTISSVLRGKRKQTKGYVFRYA